MMRGVRPPAARVSFRRRLGRVRMAAFGPRKVQFVAQLQAQRRQVFEPESRPALRKLARQEGEVVAAGHPLDQPGPVAPRRAARRRLVEVQDRDVGVVRQPAPGRLVARQPDDPQRPPRGKF